MSALPTFCVIGAMKSGTTSLHHYLAAHPEISMSRPKELDFFVAEKNYDRGVDWYASHFDDAAAVRGESSTNYTKCHIFDGVPARMNALLPNVKLIYVLRDPIERLISHYEHNRSRGRESRTFDEALRSPERNHYVQCSQYLTQLEAFLEYYSLEQIHVVDAHELRQERSEALSAIFRFLAVDDSFYDPAYEQEHGKSSIKREPTVLDRWARQLGWKRAMRRLVPGPIQHAYRSLTGEPLERPELNGARYEQVAEVLSQETEQLRRLTGQRFEHWQV